jgi:hypothetical protein
VSLRCKVCGAKHPLQAFAAQMDEAFEEEVAFVPLDRL